MPALLKWRFTMRTVWSAVILLALLGVTASVGRTYSVAEGLAGPRPVPAISRLDEWSTRGTGVLIGVPPGSERFRDLQQELTRFLGKFNSYPGATLLHVVPGALIMLLAPFQFSRRVRTRHIRLHRWSGRTIVALAIPMGLSGLFFGLFVPFDGRVEASAVGVFGALFLFAVLRGFAAIRAGDTRTHREWMIRMFAVALGVSAQRVIGSVMLLVTREGPAEWFGESIWMGFAVTVGTAELWIRGTRRRPGAPPAVALPDGAGVSGLAAESQVRR
jgi:uncharacterized membrane protein